MNSPWWKEHDQLDFESSGLRCALRRGPLGAWCGYVAVPVQHPLAGKGYSETFPATEAMLNKIIPENAGTIPLLIQALRGTDKGISLDVIIDVHGGLTYAGDNWPEKDAGWWFGFDCSHAGDLAPGMLQYMQGLSTGDIYRDEAYAKAETEKLAKQLAEWTA